MKYFLKLVCATVITTTLFLQHAAVAHDGHPNEDILLNDLGNLGEVSFHVSCNKDVQQAVNTGTALLHHMMYAQAELLFSKWIEKEPDCSMLYWGYSMSLFHPLWPDTITDEALGMGEAALANASKLTSTPREQLYINAAAQYYKDWNTVTDKVRTREWANAQALVYKENPSDIDAAAFFALSQLVMASPKDVTFEQNRETGALLETLRERSPTHPGAIHYSIHAYDNPVLAELAIDAARDYEKIAPDVPHALHMPSHIFVRLGIWSDVVSWNVRSAKAALKYPTNGSTSMHYVHAMDYLIYGYLQQGEGDKALQALEQISPHEPIQNTFPVAYALAAMPARIALEQKQWRRASTLKTRQPDYISWHKFPQVEAITYFARGLGAARAGDRTLAQENVAVLDALYDKTKLSSPDTWALLVDAQRIAVRAWISYGAGQQDQALLRLRQAADIEDSIEKNPVTPGAVIPSRELLADMLFLTGDYSGALAAYKSSLALRPNRMYSMSGASEASIRLAAQLE